VQHGQNLNHKICETLRPNINRRNGLGVKRVTRNDKILGSNVKYECPSCASDIFLSSNSKLVQRDDEATACERAFSYF